MAFLQHFFICNNMAGDRPTFLIILQLISELQEQTSIIITTNKGFEEWAEFLDDAALATAILDRLSFRCDRIQIAGKSYRLENRKSFLESRGVDNDES